MLYGTWQTSKSATTTSEIQIDSFISVSLMSVDRLGYGFSAVATLHFELITLTLELQSKTRWALHRDHFRRHCQGKSGCWKTWHVTNFLIKLPTPHRLKTGRCPMTCSRHSTHVTNETHKFLQVVSKIFQKNARSTIHGRWQYDGSLFRAFSPGGVSCPWWKILNLVFQHS